MARHITAPDLAGRRLGLFFAAYFGLVGILAPYMPLYFEQRGLSAVEIGLLIALGQAMRMVGPNLWGWLADRSGHRTRILRTTSLALVASFALLFFPGGFGFVFAAMVLVNFFQTAQMPVAEALASAQLRGQAEALAQRSAEGRLVHGRDFEQVRGQSPPVQLAARHCLGNVARRSHAALF